MKRLEQYPDYISRLYHDQITKSDKRELSRTVTFQVTENCNLACTYCYQKHKSEKAMSFDIAKRYIDLILSGDKGFKDYIDPSFSKAIVLDFIGGEPLLEIKLIDKIVDYFITKAFELNHPWLNLFRISICSNGVLYTNPDVQKFLYKNKDKMSFSVTLDGNKELHDSCRIFPDGSPSYHYAEYATTDWMQRGFKMGSKITIAKENLPHMVTATKHILSLNYTDINANCVFEADWNEQDAKLLYHNLKEIGNYILSTSSPEDIYFSFFEETFFKPMDESDNDNWCGGTGEMLACDPTGKLFPCIRYMESSLNGEQKPICIGDVYNGIAQCSDHKHCINCLNNITRRSQSTDECFNCPIASGCAWCSGYNYQIYGTPNKRATKICIMHKARALANCYYWNTYYRKTNQSKRMQLHVPKDWALDIISLDEFNMLSQLSQET